MVTIDEILKRWLVNGAVEVAPESLVASFGRVESLLGREWLEQTLVGGVVGPSVTLSVHGIGDDLEALGGARNADALIQRLKKRESASFSELEALALCVKGVHAEVEVEPLIVTEKGGNRVPDFRFHRSDEDWIHAEVTAADASVSA